MARRAAVGDHLAVVILAALGVLVLAALAWPAQSHDWYRGLKVPGTTRSCCNEHDCAPTLARMRDGVWFADAPDGREARVPPERVLQDQAHPGGAAVLCWRGAVICFVPPRAGG